jgi:1-acyl-sn-glycerol-3-phosphate acyltransferase
MPFFPRRFLRFMAKSELFWFPLSLVIRAGGGFRVRRGEHDEQAIATAVDLVRAGHAVVMFPEGTRRQKGLRKKHEARWRSGAARIALQAEAPLVPAGISGTERLARLGPLRVSYGPPLDMDDLRELPTAEASRVATERLADAVGELERGLA